MVFTLWRGLLSLHLFVRFSHRAVGKEYGSIQGTGERSGRVG